MPIATDSATMPATATRQAAARWECAADKAGVDDSVCSMEGPGWGNRHFIVRKAVHPEK
jgi:hypothetical protein